MTKELEMIIIEALRHQPTHIWYKRREILDKIDEVMKERYYCERW